MYCGHGGNGVTCFKPSCIAGSHVAWRVLLPLRLADPVHRDDLWHVLPPRLGRHRPRPPVCGWTRPRPEDTVSQLCASGVDQLPVPVVMLAKELVDKEDASLC